MREPPDPEHSQDNQDSEEWLRRQVDELQVREEPSPEEWEEAVCTFLGEYLPAISALKISRGHFTLGLVELLDKIVGLPGWPPRD